MTKRLLPILALLPPLALADEYVDIRPFPGSSRAVRESKEDQKILLPQAPLDTAGKAGRQLELRGNFNKSVWKNPKGKSTKEIYDGYVRELSTAGFKPLYACAGKDCGAPASVKLLGKVPASPEAHYALSQLVRRELGDAYAAIQVAPSETTLLIVEVTSSKDAKEQAARDATAAAKQVTAPVIGEALTRDGHIALVDILYRPGEVGLRPEAASVVKEIAALMKKDRLLRLYVVGHTDEQGDYERNLSVSKRRAEWLVKHLVDQGVSKSRLRANGVGPLAPLATNDTEDGRARNRRVELVKQ
jgi:outer membrane protein OmpA-like peptidoglycan-associated protein